MTASNKGVDRSDADHASEVDQLARAIAAVEDLIASIRPEQWSAPTPCSEWTVRQLVAHLIGMNRAFVALLDDEPMPRPAASPGVRPTWGPRTHLLRAPRRGYRH
jgi:uncharacterized protein (TIGR03083 family)